MSPETRGGGEPFPASVIERAHANHLESFRGLARILAKGRIEEDTDALYLRTDLPAPDFNLVVVGRPPADPARIARRARAFFRGWDGPRRIVATPDAAAGVGPLAKRLGLSAAEDVPLMILDPLGRPAVPLPDGVTVERIEDPSRLKVYFETGGRGYGAPDGAFEPVTGHPETVARLLADPSWTNYLATCDGKPVATALRYTTHRVAGIYFVATIPEYRGRGIGGAITMRAALDGLAEGCTISGLQATAMGYPVYERLGYRTAYNYVTWASAGNLSATATSSSR